MKSHAGLKQIALTESHFVPYLNAWPLQGVEGLEGRRRGDSIRC